MKKTLAFKLLCTTIATSSLIVAIPLINTSCKSSPAINFSKLSNKLILQTVFSTTFTVTASNGAQLDTIECTTTSDLNIVWGDVTDNGTKRTGTITIGNDATEGEKVFSIACANTTAKNMSVTVDPVPNGVVPWNLLTINTGGSITGHGDITSYNKLTLPSNVTSIANEVFKNSLSLESVDLSCLTNASIGTQTFSGCDNLLSVDLSGLTSGSIGTNCFASCDKLASVDLSGLTSGSVDDGAFSSCPSLTYLGVKMPTNLSGASNLATITTSTGKILFDKSTKKVVGNLAVGSLSWSDLSSSMGATVANSAFANCASLTSIDLSSCDSTIGNYAFYRCTSLATVNLTGYTNYIGQDAFEECSALEYVDLSGVSQSNKVQTNTFKGCTSLNSIKVDLSSATVTWGYNCFANTSLTGNITNVGNKNKADTLTFFTSCGLSSTGWTVNNT